MKSIKNMWKSWVIWFNGLLAFILTLSDYVISVFPQIEPYIPEGKAKQFILFVNVINLALRFKTNKPLSEK